jgi:opacity protein-like surface antigen
MKRVLLGAALLVLAMLPAAATASADEPGHANRFTAHLTAAQEVQTPPVVSNARGTGVFTITDNDTKIHFRLSGRNFDPTHRILQAHIHLAPKGMNGSIVLFLFPLNAAGVNPEGFSVSGTLTAADVVPAPAGSPAPTPTFAEIVAAMRAGNTYANIHTLQFKAGEIRGQILHGGDDD